MERKHLLQQQIEIRRTEINMAAGGIAMRPTDPGFRCIVIPSSPATLYPDIVKKGADLCLRLQAATLLYSCVLMTRMICWTGLCPILSTSALSLLVDSAIA